jgi:type II secretory pathway pseudopilin PulG
MKIKQTQKGFTPTPIMSWWKRIVGKGRTEEETHPSVHLQHIRNNHHKNTTTRLVLGFTLIETLVAITVLLGAIAGPLTLANNSLITTRIARERLSATMLAQEAIEYVRMVRGGNFLQGSGWLSGLGPCSGNGCYIDIPDGTISSCGRECEAMNQNTETYQYGYTIGGNWVASPYTRTVTMTQSGDETIVRAQVSWQDGNTTRTVTAEDVLYRWYGTSE